MSYNGGNEIRLDLVLGIGPQPDMAETCSLLNLKRFFEKPQYASHIAALNDKAYYEIFNVLFKTNTLEKNAFLKNKKSSRQLELFAEVMRIVIKAAVPSIRSKTLHILVEHHTQALTPYDNAACQLIRSHYLRNLSLIFQFYSHVEHLKVDRWLDTVDFCLQGIDRVIGVFDRDSLTLTLNSSSSGVCNSSASRPQSDSSNFTRQTSLARQNSEELFKILFLLVSTPNSPIFKRFSTVGNTVVDFLQVQGTNINKTNYLAFAIINVVLSFTRLNFISFTKSIAKVIIPIIRRFLQAKVVAKDEMLNSLRDEMMILFCIIHSHLEGMIMDKDFCIILPELVLLLEVMRSDYSRRSERDQLQIDNLEVTDIEIDDCCFFQLHCFRLRADHYQAERNWAFLKILGILERLINLTNSSRPMDHSSYTNHLKKRQRRGEISDGLIENIESDDERTRLAALHILPFILQNLNLSRHGLITLLTQLHSSIRTENSKIHAWTLIVITSCSYQNEAPNIDLSIWKKFWHVGARCLTHPSTCRPASAVLFSLLKRNLVNYQDVAEYLNSILTTAEINGPVSISDASILFMLHILKTRNKEVPSSSTIFAHQIINWLFARWRPVDKNHAMQNFIYVHPEHILLLLKSCSGIHQEPVLKIRLPCGRLAQVWQKYLSEKGAVHYLLLINETILSNHTTEANYRRSESYSNLDSMASILPTTRFQTTRRLTLELLNSLCINILRDWRSYITDHISSITSEIYGNAVNSCIVMLSMLCSNMVVESDQTQTLMTNSLLLAKELVTPFPDTQNINQRGQRKFNKVLIQAIEPFLPVCGSQMCSSIADNTPYLLQFFILVAERLEEIRIIHSESQNSAIDVVETKEDDFLPLQLNQTIVSTRKLFSMPRNRLALDHWEGSFEISIIGKLHLLAAINSKPDFTGIIPPIFFEYILPLTDEEFLSSQKLILDILDSNLTINDSYLSRLIERLGRILSCDLLDRCEVTLVMCAETLVALRPFCLTPILSDVADSALQIYEWLVNIAIGKNIASPEVQKSMSKLLLLVLHSGNPEYGSSESTPSPRSCLFEILRNGTLEVKFYIADQINKIFEIYTLKDHEVVFTDLLDILPINADWIEGICFRIFILAKVGLAVTTLFRRCIYYIFETASNIHSSSAHASICLREISNKLGISSPRELFKLYSSQILYTWLEQKDVRSIPFQIFGFNSLLDLTKIAKEELTALMIMRGHDESFQHLASILFTDQTKLIQESFTKVAAYSIAYDLSNSVKLSEIDTKIRISKGLSDESFFQLIRYHFVDILVIFFNCIDREESADRYFMKSRDLEYAGKIVEKINSFSSSTTVLPTNQQPLFSVKYLVPEIRYLCSLVQLQFEGLFTPTLLTHIARSLFDTNHHVLGSAHACSALRKLKILISLSGNIAITGYPLEMLLHSLRFYLQNLDCVDDAIGIIQYLLDAGSLNLLCVPSFVAGVSLSIFCTIREFYFNNTSSLNDKKYQITKTNIQNLHFWMRNYLKNFRSPMLCENKRDHDFKTLIDAVSNSQLIGNADINTSESSLLMRLLRHEGPEVDFLDESSRKISLSMLISQFRDPKSYKNDVCGDDKNSHTYAPAILKSYQASSAREYRVWAAKVVGRAFASSGHIYEELICESKLGQMRDCFASQDGIFYSSSALLNLLKELVLGHDLKVIGIAEKALRYIVTHADGNLAIICSSTLPNSLMITSVWDPYQQPPSERLNFKKSNSDIDELLTDKSILEESWVCNFSTALARSTTKEPLLAAMVEIISEVTGFADKAFPFLIHLVLSVRSSSLLHKKNLSSAYNSWLGNPNVKKSYKRVLLDSILYLRTRALPSEKSPAERAYWLDINYLTASVAAISCGMFKTALLFFEEFDSQLSKLSQRSSNDFRDKTTPYETHSDILLQIYKNIDDFDLYYGVKQNADWKTVLARLDYEKNGFKSLAFKGAKFDSQVRKSKTAPTGDVQSLVKEFDVLGLNGVSNSLLQAHQTVCLSEASIDCLFRTSRKLEQWDVPVPTSCRSNSAVIYKVFQAINTASDHFSVRNGIDEGLEFFIDKIIYDEPCTSELHEALQYLASLVEIDEIFGSSGSCEFENVFNRFKERSQWMSVGNLNDVNTILSCRNTSLSMLSQKRNLQDVIKIKELDSRFIEVKTALLASKIIRAHKNLQESLSLTTSMIDLITSCHAVGLHVEAAIHLEAADTLWDQEEISSSVGILKMLNKSHLLKTQTITIGHSLLLAKIGYQVSVGKLEKSDVIIEKYLGPALRELNGQIEGDEAGQVFHQFATFCDQQLQDPDILEDLERVKRQSRVKAREVKDYDKLIAKAQSLEIKKECFSRQIKAKAWLKIDEEDLERQVAHREKLLSHCLENYLLSLVASNDHNRNALRFLALWLEHSSEDVANNAVAKYLRKVPTLKFAGLMNQLTSRLQDTKEIFQELLFQLIMDICTDHPYHGMYQIFAGAYSDINDKDESAVLRKNATKALANRFYHSQVCKKIWSAIQLSSKAYCNFAGEKNSLYKAGKSFSLNISPAAMALNGILKKYSIPTPTRHIPLSVNLDYSKVSTVLKLKPEFLIASGLSAPKIVSTITENGEQFKQIVSLILPLFSFFKNARHLTSRKVKGGNDDLRQDAIMEQVFEQVNEVLKTNRSTRQRELSIRTYRVIPLTNMAGIIEFVPNTIPLHDYLMPAHERFYPKDLKPSRCRSEIAAVQAKGSELRLKTFQAVIQRFHPVMRYFFTENFLDPDEWFVKRLAYIRSTAAISIIGHILGLGDRHAHNILLDQKSGEIVHIDLGIAFEMGRILPIPETVPFRLTRDIVDGMGITKTEGVFRRCCEATLEALLEKSSTIMSILDVLRYDPLYSWSVSPVRLAKLREEQQLQDISDDTLIVGTRHSKAGEKLLVNEPGEAARALSTISKKLTKSLSVYATVNDLINQASDEKNLAFLFAGWAAYA